MRPRVSTGLLIVMPFPCIFAAKSLAVTAVVNVAAAKSELKTDAYASIKKIDILKNFIVC